TTSPSSLAVPRPRDWMYISKPPTFDKPSIGGGSTAKKNASLTFEPAAITACTTACGDFEGSPVRSSHGLSGTQTRPALVLNENVSGSMPDIDIALATAGCWRTSAVTESNAAVVRRKDAASCNMPMTNT